MKYNKLATVLCSAALGLLALTSCEGGDLFGINSPDWLSSRADSIAAAKAANQGGDVIEGLEEDVYTVGATDYSTGWWAQFSKYYQIPEGGKWIAQFNLNINPAATNTYKNFAMIITNDEDRGAANYKEYGAIRYDNQPSGNSEWGDYIDRSLVTSDLTFETDTDTGVDKLGGKVTLTVDRTNGGLVVTMTNGAVTKVYNQTAALTNLNADAANGTIRCFLVPEGSYISWLGSTIEPIGGFTSREDKQPLSMTLNGVPKKVLQGTSLEDAFANVTATIQFEQEVSATVKASDLTFQAVPDMYSLGKKTLVAVYAKSYKGEAAAAPVIGSAEFEVVDKMYTCVGATDNSSAWWTAFSDMIKVAPGETFVSTFTNYTSGANNWNNFCIVLSKGDLSLGADGEYAVVRADNYGWGNGYAACTATGTQGDWATWLAAMDGAKVTTYITNNGNGTADVKAVMVGNDGVTYEQSYTGINTVDPNDFYFRFVVDGSHIEFDTVIGEDDNSTAWWTAFSDLIQVPAGKTYTTRFKNFTSGANNWNNFCIALVRADLSLGAAGEYAVVRADNYGWGDSYAACTATGTQGDWASWLQAMDDATVTVSITNNGSSADVRCVMVGNDGETYTQNYIGISPIDGSDFNYRFVVDGSHMVFE
jgi:hypothetical protein